MISYRIAAHKEAQYLHFEATFPVLKQKKLQLQLPAWRPGRYELGNFAKNIRDFEVRDKKGNVLPSKKRNKDLWEVETGGAKEVYLSYNYFAVDLNAGSTYVDKDLLYFNPVNCFFYDAKNPVQRYRLELGIPKKWKVATGMTFKNGHWWAENTQHLLDTPVLCSPSLKAFSYKVDGVNYYVQFYGEPALKESKWKEDFIAFTKSQVKAFGDIPCAEYHFLILFHKYAAYHGVEHSNSTVISIGPETAMGKRKGYKELLGVSCHELYHTWNIKNIRPKEMMPYDFAKENYSELGFVAEGVTTYFGDQFLHRSGVFSDAEYFAELGKLIQRHRDNKGRHHYSVAESSWDTWLDGYVMGATGRKVSIYTEGALIALMCDIAILKATNGRKSLDDAMKAMYERYGKKQKGYTEKGYKSILEKTAGISFDRIFEEFVHGRNDYLKAVSKQLSLVGLEVKREDAPSFLEKKLGIKADRISGGVRVLAVAPKSPAAKAGLCRGDIITILKKEKAKLEFSSRKKAITCVWKRREIEHSKELKLTAAAFFPRYTVKKIANASKSQQTMFDFWKNR